ncbi:MAG: PQQ-binding-like beta-propeller repeat protein, partial [Planctomycetota bacterium]|nr:PQQ-binding-like beta-propeller repeat protein [Planctomycetota bacterium]
RHHDRMSSVSAEVSAGGRVYYIIDEGSRISILMPSKWMLIARDAFNGTILWKRPIPEWNTHLWPLKSGPNQLPRRLVAIGNRVYVTLGIDAPVAMLDAATGETLRTYAGTKHTDEILAADGVLYLLVAPSPNKWKEYRPKFTYVWDNTSRANKEWAWDQADRHVLAVQAETGTVLWKQERRVAPLTLGADRERVFFYNGEKVVCLNRTSGQELWTSEPVLRKLPFPTGYGPTLVIEQDVVLLSVENRSMTALAAADGKTLWQAPHHPGGHASPDDLLVIHGLVWSGDVGGGQSSGLMTGRDLQTGEVKSEFPPDVKPDWFHHRCYRSRATDQYFIASRTGLEFIDLQAQHWDFNHWVRGGCLYGFMPCNGLVYAPPHACGCFLESKLFGFQALAPGAPRVEKPKSKKVEESESSDRLEEESACEIQNPKSKIPNAADWPTYRHDAQRSGAVKTSVPTELKRAWQTELGGKLSSLVVAEGRVFVAAVNAHTVHALDADSGRLAWSYTVGGRVDSPPTIHQGRVLFGSADGWVYCLRAADGKLCWRFRAAPENRRLVAYEQLESAWPVSGSVLVQDDVVYCVAGRSAFLDGGMRLVRLDPETGRKISETLLNEHDPDKGENLQAKIKGQDMPVALPDILSCDGRSVYMRNQAFDLAGVPRDVAPVKIALSRERRRGEAEEPAEETAVRDHLFSRSGFLDDSWFFRSYWIYGSAVDSNYGGWLRPGHFAPCGRLMVFDDACLYGFDRKPEYLCNASVQEYYLYGADRQVSDEAVQRIQAATNRINASSTSKQASMSDWAARKKFSLTDQNVASFKWAAGNPPIQARGLVLADQTLFVAGPPDLLDEEEAWRNPDDPAIQAKLAAQTAALQGRRGGQLLALAATDGKLLAAYELDALPTFDGMVAAQGKLYLSTVDGRVLCLGGQGTPLATAPEFKLASLDVSVKPVTPEPEPQLGPSLQGDFAQVVKASVTRSDLGYHLRADGKQTGLALKQLPAPVVGKIDFKGRLKCASDGALKNGFLVFGDAPEEARLVKCGLRFLMGKAVIIQGSINGGKVTEKDLELDESKVYEIRVTVDLVAGQVTMRIDGTTLTATLEQRLENISWVGYETLNAATDFSPLEISAP